VTLALTLACSAVPAAALQREVRPTTDTAREADRSSVGTRSVTGTVTKTTDKGIVVVGREDGEKDSRRSPWMPARASKRAVRSDANDLRQGDPVTVTYTNRDGKIVAPERHSE
jgi:hypothetical protein